MRKDDGVRLTDSAAPGNLTRPQIKALSLPPKSKFSRFDGYPEILLQYVAILTRWCAHMADFDSIIRETRPTFVPFIKWVRSPIP